MKNIFTVVCSLTVITLSSCARIPSDELTLAQKCESFRCPSSRDKFVTHFNLKDEMRDAQPFSGCGLRGGMTTNTERWSLASGNSIIAHDSIYVGPVAITRDSLNIFLNSTDKEEDLPMRLRLPSLPIKKVVDVDNFLVMSDSGGVIYSSYPNEKQSKMLGSK